MPAKSHDFFSEDDSFEVPAYATLFNNQIIDPVGLVARCVERGLVILPKHSKTQSRPPPGKKLAPPYRGPQPTRRI